jgi:polyhydroxyalkanoate synthase subunit PhaC
VVNPPGTVGSSYRVTRHAASGKYVDPDTWLKSTPVQQGSWWPTWAAWLRGHANEHSGEHKARRVKATPLQPMGRNGQLLVDAPGSYVFES